MEKLNKITQKKPLELLSQSFKKVKKNHINIITITSKQSYSKSIKGSFVLNKIIIGNQAD